METHIPVLFLDLSADDFQDNLSAPLAGGLDALLNEEDEDEFFDLHIVKQHDTEVRAEASWDSTVHDCAQLSRGTPADQRVFLTVRAVVLLSHPAHMQLVLRKRICVSLTGRQGFAQSLLKRMSQRSSIPGCGVTFEIVSNIPGDIQGPEDREMLARLAASAEDGQSADSEAAIEKYLRSVLAVENILTLDRLRQEVAVKEQLAVKGKIPRRCLSSPNVNRGWESHQDLSYLSRRTLPSSVSQNLHPETVKAVPKLLKSLFPGGKEEKRDPTPVPLQSLPRIMVQSASVEEGMNIHQQPIPIDEVFPPEIKSETPRSMALPPPIIPETEEYTPTPSEASSGYVSTSISMATLSDVYTLSWDLPQMTAGKTEGFVAEPSEEGRGSEVKQQATATSDPPESDFWTRPNRGDPPGPQMPSQFLMDNGAMERSDQLTIESHLSSQPLTAESPSSAELQIEESAPSSEPQIEELAPSSEPQIEESAPSSEPEIEESAPSSEPQIEESAPSSEPQTEESAPSSEPEIEESSPSSEPQIEESAPSSEPQIEESAPSSEPQIEESAPSSEPQIEESAPSSEPQIEESAPSSEPQIEESALLSQPRTEESPPPSEPQVDVQQTEEFTLPSGPPTENSVPPSKPQTEESPLSCEAQTEKPPCPSLVSDTVSNLSTLGNQVPVLSTLVQSEELLEGGEQDVVSELDQTKQEVESIFYECVSEQLDEPKPPKDTSFTPECDSEQPVVTNPPLSNQSELEPSLTDQSKPKSALIEVKTESEPTPMQIQTEPSTAVVLTELETAVSLPPADQIEQDQPPAMEHQEQPTQPASDTSDHPATALLITKDPTCESDQDMAVEPTQISSTTTSQDQFASIVSDPTLLISKDAIPILAKDSAPGTEVAQLLAPTSSQDPSTAMASSATPHDTQAPPPNSAVPMPTSAPESITTPSLTELTPSPAVMSAANPFKIQKVKSSDLKSFQRILGEEEGKLGQLSKTNSLGMGLNLPEPMDRLEIISDNEEGSEATTVTIPDWLREGEFVTVGTNKSGTVRYVGPTDFAQGIWVGVELEVPAGKNDGSVAGKHYFHCNPGYGVLVRPDRVSRGGAKRRRQQQQQKRRSANLSGSSPNLAALTALAKGEGGGLTTSRKGENRKSWNN